MSSYPITIVTPLYRARPCPLCGTTLNRQATFLSCPKCEHCEEFTMATNTETVTATSKTERAAQLLRDAAKSIETALVLLDTRRTNCGECGTRHWTNLTHARVYQQLTDSPTKLRNAAASIEDTTKSNRRPTPSRVIHPEEQ